MKIDIRCDHALHGGAWAFVIDQSGQILEISLDVASWDAPIPVRFDTKEYYNFYKRLDPTIDILDIGYYLPDGKLEKPEADFRLNVIKEMADELAERLDNVSASLENCLAHNGKPMSEADFAARNTLCAEARQFLRKNSYIDPPEEVPF